MLNLGGDSSHLDLSGNDIAPDGAESLARVLGQYESLAHLDLRGNRIYTDRS
jgi:Ran GTPase-activating protein (RanGAP) involved in mRNA processing and transport